MEEQDELTQMVNNARKIVSGCTSKAVAAGTIPVPGVDATIQINELVSMLVTIDTVFKINVSKDVLRKLIGPEINGLVGKNVLTSALKLVVGVGSIVGAAISGNSASKLTATVGNAYIEQCIHMKQSGCNDCDAYLSSDEGRIFFEDTLKKKKKTVTVSNVDVKPMPKNINWEYYGFDKADKSKQFNVKIKYEGNEIGVILFERFERSLKCIQINIDDKYDEVVVQVLENIGSENKINILLNRDILSENLIKFFNESNVTAVI